jgi:hypothetical protein
MPLLLISLAMLFYPAFAEYRVYLLDINLPGNTHKIFASTMDHQQFKQWVRGIENNKVETMDSWICQGDTSGFKPLCSKPVSVTPVKKGGHDVVNR